MLLARRHGLTGRIADTLTDLRAAQRLRYQVFYEELGAKPDHQALTSRLDEDPFDGRCDHLLVVEENGSSTDGTAVHDGRLVGTYRLLRQEVAERTGGFYTAREFEIEPLMARFPNLRFLELGRSCVAREFRSKPVVELLWQGNWNYVRRHKIDVMMGCASLAGTDPDALADELTFLAHVSPAPADWTVSALPELRVEMKRKPIDSVDRLTVLKTLPPLIKGYLRLGCYIGENAIIDSQFNTIDVLILLPVSRINPRYFCRFGMPDQ